MDDNIMFLDVVKTSYSISFANSPSWTNNFASKSFADVIGAYIGSENAENDSIMKLLFVLCSESIESVIGKSILSNKWLVKFPIVQPNFPLLLPYGSVKNINAVNVNCNGNYTLVDSAKYYLLPGDRIYMLANYSKAGENCFLEIDYNAGPDYLSDLNPSIMHELMCAVRRAYMNRDYPPFQKNGRESLDKFKKNIFL